MNRTEPTSPTAQVQDLLTMTGTTRLLREMPKVTIAAINGVCAGGGLSLALACDLRYAAAASAIFATAFVDAGLSGDFVIRWLLPRIVRPAKARELRFVNDRFTADEALAMGAVNAVLPDRGFLEAVGERAERPAAKAPLAIAGLEANLVDRARWRWPSTSASSRSGWSPRSAPRIGRRRAGRSSSGVRPVSRVADPELRSAFPCRSPSCPCTDTSVSYGRPVYSIKNRGVAK
jgi:enoyl-CoA hydratase/carnithine racemase